MVAAYAGNARNNAPAATSAASARREPDPDKHVVPSRAVASPVRIMLIRKAGFCWANGTANGFIFFVITPALEQNCRIDQAVAAMEGSNAPKLNFTFNPTAVVESVSEA